MAEREAQEALDEARGRLLDGLAALRNVEQLLGSVKVSPKALLQVLPDTAASCERMIASLGAFGGAVTALIDEPSAKSLGAPQTVAALSEHLKFHLRELATQIRAVGSNLNAAKRLQLEVAFTEHGKPLATTIGLVDLLHEALVGRRGILDFTDLLKDSRGFDQVFDQIGKRRTAWVLLPDEPLIARVNARVLLSVLAVSAAWLSQQHDGELKLELSQAGGNPRVELSTTTEPIAGQGSSLELAIPPWLDISQRTAELAMGLAGCRLEFSSSSARARIECASAE